MEKKGWYESSIRGTCRRLGLTLLEGRNFSEADSAESQRVAMINDSMATMLWPQQRAPRSDIQEQRQTTTW